MVAISWATFIIGPLSPPSAAASAAAPRARSRSHAEEPVGGDAGGDAAHIGADPGVAGGAGGEPVCFSIASGAIVRLSLPALRGFARVANDLCPKSPK